MGAPAWADTIKLFSIAPVGWPSSGGRSTPPGSLEASQARSLYISVLSALMLPSITSESWPVYFLAKGRKYLRRNLAAIHGCDKNSSNVSCGIFRKRPFRGTRPPH
eukprot:4665826-Pyramimonas_sp.AAC.1